jgi:hypothetical protein
MSGFKITPPFYPIAHFSGYAITLPESVSTFYDAYYVLLTSLKKKREALPINIHSHRDFYLRLRNRSENSRRNRTAGYHCVGKICCRIINITTNNVYIVLFRDTPLINN